MEFVDSEKYRKYLINLRSVNFSGFIVWGADMADEENDKLFLRNGKILLLTSTKNIRSELIPNQVFKDEQNFEMWRNSDEVYLANSTVDLTVLTEFSESSLGSKDIGFNLISCINLIRDYSLQVQHDLLNAHLDSKVIQELFDFLYNEFFWKKVDGIKNSVDARHIQSITMELNKICDLFCEDFSIV